MEIRPQTQIAEVASAHPAIIRVFQRHGVDFCCGGKRPLSEACGEKGLAFEDLRRELAAAIAGSPESQRSWPEAPLDQLVSFIVDRYHQRHDGRGKIRIRSRSRLAELAEATPPPPDR